MSDWSEAYRRYSPEIRAFLERRLWRRPDEAEDLCQETFRRVMSASTVLRDPTKLRSYLLRTANNLLISSIRRPRIVSSESDLGLETELTARVDPRAADPHAETERVELRHKLELLVAKLPEDQRLAFVSGVIQKQPYAEIAKEHGWTVPKVKICIFRARKRLMKNLGEYR